MKLFGRIVFGFFVVLLGFWLYSCSSAGSYNNALRVAFDEAIVSGDFKVFNEQYEYAYKDPFIDNELVTIIDGDNRLGEIKDKDISFNISVFLQLKVEKPMLKKAENIPVFSILITDLSLENRNQYLDIVIYKSNITEVTSKNEQGEDVVELKEEIIVFEYFLNSFGSENWYTQVFELDSTNIERILITHPGPSSKEPIILYDSGALTFISENDHQIANVLEKDLPLEANNIIKVGEKLFKVSLTMTIVTMIIYIGLAGLVAYAMFFKKDKQGPIVQQKVNNTPSKPIDRRIIETPKENINIKNIEETKKTDDVKNKKDK